MAYYMYMDKILFPITPGEINTKINGKNETITLINEGEVNLIKSPGLTDIDIPKLILPALQEYPFANHQNENGGKTNFNNARYYLDKLEKWKKSRKPIQFKLIRSTPDNSRILWDSTMDVTIEDYKETENAEEYGFDVCVELNMKQYRYFGAEKLVPKKKSKKKKKASKTKVIKKKSRAKKKSPAKSYTVKKGDTLRGIAKKQLNSIGKWKDIYTLNKKTIQSVAKKRGKPGNGHWIFPGTKLKLPK